MPESKKAQTVAEYLAKLPEDRKKALTALRKTVRASLGKGFEETINWGMISYEVPLKAYPDTYNGKPLMFAGLASKSQITVHFPAAYMDPKVTALIQSEFKKRGLKLDMGKGCMRFKRLEDIPLDVISKLVRSLTLKKYLTYYEKAHQ